ncbi:unnamed protein product [Microthlaspi erraticum]|uniref:Uncharacterized protein n=1 Tax=Microthlaspi erraticum TaxID=1685480 RepID=A0A6D2I906_9BRAS|nr:unnamed protein product [Microthlaspi erraticum]
MDLIWEPEEVLHMEGDTDEEDKQEGNGCKQGEQRDEGEPEEGKRPKGTAGTHRGKRTGRGEEEREDPYLPKHGLIGSTHDYEDKHE